VLPVISLTTFYIALTTRLVRSSVSDVMDEDYVRTATAKGLRERPILLSHVVPNSLIPVVTATAINAAYLFGGSIIVEEIFAIPGVGRLLFTAVSNRDFPLIQGIALLSCIAFILSSFVADVLSALLDPRLRAQ
jgi:peptide/nickel transport system permease protein